MANKPPKAKKKWMVPVALSAAAEDKKVGYAVVAAGTAEEAEGAVRAAREAGEAPRASVWGRRPDNPLDIRTLEVQDA